MTAAPGGQVLSSESGSRCWRPWEANRVTVSAISALGRAMAPTRVALENAGAGGWRAGPARRASIAVKSVASLERSKLAQQTGTGLLRCSQLERASRLERRLERSSRAGGWRAGSRPI